MFLYKTVLNFKTFVQELEDFPKNSWYYISCGTYSLIYVKYCVKTIENLLGLCVIDTMNDTMYESFINFHQI